MTREERARRQALAARQRDDDLASVAATPAGRCFLIALLDDLHGPIVGAASHETLIRFAALRDRAIVLEQRLAKLAPESYRLLKAEQVSEHILDIQTGS